MHRTLGAIALTTIGLIPFNAMADNRNPRSADSPTTNLVTPQDSVRGIVHQGPAVIDEAPDSVRPSPEQLESELDRVNPSPPHPR